MMNSDLNVRQLRLMLTHVDLFKSGVVPLGELVVRLDSLRSAMESPPQAWSESFQTQWSALEEVYAVMLDEEIEDPHFEEDLIQRTVADVEQGITEQLKGS